MTEEKQSDKANDSDPENPSCDIPLMDHKKSRYPFCIVWTPLPIITWICPLIGHMGIAMSSGVIRDFAGPYYVSEDDMAFGKPTKYWQLHPEKARGGRSGWDAGVAEASRIYKERMHNICCDNCHSHVACALNIMQYDGSTSWNMVKLWFFMLVYGRYLDSKQSNWLSEMAMKIYLPILAEK
ncbi:transmembrane protein 222 [Trichonephila inaurata madagascariensis]|uniref:Transmembrane protein 222 n=1 Tax=Trichonephila inaurata madagascariensis TaxID=2747483 RepID=A0A8X6IGL5_9ARAC|nr:transmembrane protein 222 [Trichonephila inaurata madagascariensis]